MKNLLTTPLDELASDDLEALVNNSVPEGDQIEYKSSLPSKNGDDKWLDGQTEVGSYAKNCILEEVTAFANAHGGVLLVGIEDSPGNQGIPTAIKALPQCSELANRFKLIFRDCIEPSLPTLEVASIETTDGNGVLLIRAGRSHDAPHRVKSTLQCTIRRQDRCERMSMREIQDLTLNTTRGAKQLEKRIRSRAKRFSREYERFSKPELAFGIRVTGLPTHENNLISQVFLNGQIDSRYSLPTIALGRQGAINRDMKYLVEGLGNTYRPVLRGARVETSWYPQANKLCYGEVSNDGLIEIGFVSDTDIFVKHFFEPDWIVGLFACELGWIDKFRKNSSVVAMEYVVSVEISIQENKVKFGRNRTMFPESEICLRHTTFPSYLFGIDSTMEGLLVLFQRDLYNSVGWNVQSQLEDFHIE